METSSLTAPSSSSTSSSSPALRRGPWTRKPLSVVLDEQGREDANGTTRRHMSLVDLVAVGVGGTVGSGVFVLTGFIAHHYAGPATFVSFIISGLAAGFSGLCYAELAGRIPAAGSTYIYAYVSLGEWAAVVAAACLTLEYGVAGAAVARSWGDKVVSWLEVQWQWHNAADYLSGDFFNPMAGLVSMASVALLAYGVQESKFVTNCSTLVKVGLVVMMIVGGLCLFDGANFSPMVPYGRAGVMRGATSSFFGYLGYDEVCCIAGEAKNPRHDLPRAVLWTLTLVTILYVLASIALVGMLPSNEISDTSGFPDAFHSRGIYWLAQLTAFGEVFTLPVVVLISLMAQPRLQLAVANDGLLPEIFARIDEKGNLTWGVLLAGIPMTILATFVPFTFLDDLISVGILIAFCITNTSLILLKCEPPIGQPNLLRESLCLYHILAFATGLSCHWVSSRGNLARGVGFFAVVVLAGWIHKTFPPTGTFGGSVIRRHDSNAEFQPSLVDEGEFFQAPFVPLFPCIGIFINWYLISQLELSGMLLLILYIATITALYLGYCRKISFRGWRRPDYSSSTGNADEFLDRDMVLLREFSMPKHSAQSNET